MQHSWFNTQYLFISLKTGKIAHKVVLRDGSYQNHNPLEH